MTKTPVPVFNVPQYCLLRSLGKVGVPCELLTIFLGRCGASQQDWQELLNGGWVTTGTKQQKNRYVMTELGQWAYRRRPKNVYF